MVSYLISVGADVNAKAAHGVTALACAAAWGYYEVVKLLLNSDADAAVVDVMGDTAADMAEQRGHDEVERLIRAHMPSRRG